MGFADTIHKILRSTCSSCGRVLLTESEIAEYKEKIGTKHQNEESINDIVKEIYTVARRDKFPHCDEDKEEINIDKPVSIVKAATSSLL